MVFATPKASRKGAARTLTSMVGFSYLPHVESTASPGAQSARPGGPTRHGSSHQLGRRTQHRRRTRAARSLSGAHHRSQPRSSSPPRPRTLHGRRRRNRPSRRRGNRGNHGPTRDRRRDRRPPRSVRLRLLARQPVRRPIDPTGATETIGDNRAPPRESPRPPKEPHPAGEEEARPNLAGATGRSYRPFDGVEVP